MYGVYISQLIRYSKAYAQYRDDLDRAQLRTQKLLKLGYIAPMLKSSLLILFGRITKWLIITKYQWIFYLLRRCFLSFITAKTLTGLDCVYELHGGCRIRSRNCLPFVSTRVHPRFLVGSVLVIFVVFCVALLWIITLWLPCLDIRYDFCMNTLFLPPVVCWRVHVLFRLFVLVCA